MLNILESIGKIGKYIEPFNSADTFISGNDQLNYNATLTLLANVSESIGKLSDDTQNELNGVDFNSIRGMRNRIVHDYTGLNSFIVFDVAKNKIGDIREQIERCLTENLNTNKFDVEEYKFASSNVFYKHVRFEKILQLRFKLEVQR